LFRQAEAGVASFATLRDDTRALVAEWKALEQKLPATPPATLRVDHLGASTFVEKGWSRLSTGDAAAAEEALHRALELSPLDPQALVLLAWALAQQEKFDHASSALMAARAGAPDFSLANVVEGLLALRQARITDAVQRLRTAVADTTADRRSALYAHLYLGVALREANALQESIDVLARALELGPNMLEAALELGHTQRACGDEIGAMATWRRAASANKFSPWGKRCAELVELHERGELAVGSSSTT
jgi:tetratricopeptide (TPR) repeat protein